MTGLDAMEKLEKTPFKVLITDIKLPDISGFNVIQRAREISESIRIIAMSSYRYEGAELDLLKKCSCGFLAKPIDINILNCLIKMHLHKETKSDSQKGMGIKIVESTDDLVQILKQKEIDIETMEEKYSMEKRKYIRYRVLLDVVFSIDRHFIQSKVLDVSREGAFIGSDITPDEGSAIDLDFFIPELESTVSALGKVMRVKV